MLLGSRANDALPAAKWPPLLLLLIGFQVWHFETAALLCNSSDARKSVKLALMHQCTEGLCIVQIFGKKKKESHWWYWFRIWVNYISKELNPKVEMKNKGIFFNKRYINFRHFGFHFKIQSNLIEFNDDFNFTFTVSQEDLKVHNLKTHCIRHTYIYVHCT